MFEWKSSRRFVASISVEPRGLYEEENGDAKELGCAFDVYNKEFTFTSTGASGHLNGSVFDGHGPPTYKIQVETFHRIGSPLPEDPGAHLYSQLYIYNPTKAFRYRKDNNRRTAPKTMTLLQTVLISDNPFVACTNKFMSSVSLPVYWLRMELLRARSAPLQLAQLAPEFSRNAVFGDVDTWLDPQSSTIRCRGGPLIRITEVRSSCIALCLSLLSPTG